MTGFARQPSSMLLHPINYTLNLIDIQGQMLFATKNIDVSELRINEAIAAAASKRTTIAIYPQFLSSLLISYGNECSGYEDTYFKVLL
jgi:hypothetical protein